MVPPLKSQRCMAKPIGAIFTAQAPWIVHLSQKKLFFQGQSTTVGSLLIITGLIHVGRGDILAAALNFVDFSNTYLVTPGQRIAFLCCRSSHPNCEDKWHKSRMKVSIGLKEAGQLLCALEARLWVSFPVCLGGQALAMGLAAGSWCVPKCPRSISWCCCWSSQSWSMQSLPCVLYGLSCHLLLCMDEPESI